MSSDAWRIFRNEQSPQQGSGRLRRLLEIEAPRWRRFGGRAARTQADAKADQLYWRKLLAIAQTKERDIERGKTFRLSHRPTPTGDNGKSSPDQTTSDDVLNAVNAALYLRRPLLVTGRPGSGKTSLAYAIAHELQLGPVLLWPITARSTLQEGLFQYDAIARLQDAQLSQNAAGAQEPSPSSAAFRDIGQYIRLGPVGTAFVPSVRPRVLLIDEIDKSDINLPNELLNLFEEGEFEIPPLVRLAKQAQEQQQQVQTEDGLTVPILGGEVQCHAFPVIIMTSNGERDFPPAFYRRCLRVRMPDPTVEDLKDIVKAHLGQDNIDEFTDLIEKFDKESSGQETGLATDQLLNIVYLLKQDADEAKLKKLLFRPLSDVDISP